DRETGAIEKSQEGWRGVGLAAVVAELEQIQPKAVLLAVAARSQRALDHARMGVGTEEHAPASELGKKCDAGAVRLRGVGYERLLRERLDVEGRQALERGRWGSGTLVGIERAEMSLGKLLHPDRLQRGKLAVAGRKQGDAEPVEQERRTRCGAVDRHDAIATE